MTRYTTDYEYARQKLEELAIYFNNTKETERTESTTRLHLIDSLFFECLGWNKDDVKLEVSQGQDYTDYEFFIAKRVMILEAKKEGKYFQIPLEKKRFKYSIPSLCKDSKDLKSAIEQVERYCQKRGVEVGVVCNGHQLVAFIANRSDGISPAKGKAIVFASFQDMLENFVELYNSLSKIGIADKYLHKKLLQNEVLTLPPKLSSRILNYPGTKERNAFQTDLQILSDIVLEDFASHQDLGTEFLRQCYSTSGALSQYSYASKKILSSRYAAIFDANISNAPSLKPAVNKKGISDDLLTGMISERPIILIGDVGVGKTSFINYLVKIEAPEEIDSAITLYIDLGAEGILAKELQIYVLEKIKVQLREKYSIDVEDNTFIRTVYKRELKRFSETSIYSQLKHISPDQFLLKEIDFLQAKIDTFDQHMKSVLDFVKRSHRRQVIVFLDNCDQRSADIQQKSFLIAQEFAKNWGAAVFVSLRPDTFYSSVKIGTLTGYHPRAFSISPPRVDRVLEKRLEFASSIARGEIKLENLSNISFSLSKLETIIEILKNSLNRNHELIEFIDNVCGGDIRLALDFIKRFLGSGHVDMEKILSINSDKNKYLIPLHELIRAITYGDAEFYSAIQSPIINLFDVEYSDPKEHFLLPFMIGLLSRLSEAGQNGFVDTSILYTKLQGYSFTPNQIDAAIARAIKYRTRLVETTARQIPEPGKDSPPAIRATTIGIYHVNKLTSVFTYIDAIVVDTPVFDRVIQQTMNYGDYIEDRLKRASIFQHYLDEQWNNFVGHLEQTLDLPFDWSIQSKLLEQDIDRIWGAHKRNKRRDQ